MSLQFWTLFLSLVCCGYGARILVILPFPGTSHLIYTRSILSGLTERGHQVIEYSPFPPKELIPNHTHFEVHTTYEENMRKWTYKEFFLLIQDKISLLQQDRMSQVWRLTYSVCEDTFKHENITALLNSNEHFDLVMTESVFGQESFLVFGHRFKAPTIALVGFSTWSVINREAGNALAIASIPDHTITLATDKMTFLERLKNFLSIIKLLFCFYNIHIPKHNSIIKEYYGNDAPPLEDMLTNISLYLVNTRPTVEYPVSYTPNIIPISGISIPMEKTTLPQDIREFMNEAKNGVIYFSFGTVIPFHKFPKEIHEIFLNVFKKMPYRVIWKMDHDSIVSVSENVIIRKWVPQQGILTHPKCVLFLTHGGLNGLFEATHAGVPVVVVPFLGDQPYNAKVSETFGTGVKLDFKTLSEESLSLALNTVLNNPRYKENAERLSRIYKDRPVSPKDTAVFWVEYVLRHKGAHHLRPTAAHLPWYQLALLDVWAAILLGLVFVFIIIYVSVKYTLRVIIGTEKQTSVKRSKH